MNLIEEITEYVRNQYAKGKTQVEIASECNVAHSYIQRILSDEQSAGSITIRVFCRMFPDATVCLKPGHQNISSSNIAISNNGTVNQSVNEDKTANKLTDIQAEIMSMEEISAEQKVLLFRLLEKHK